MVIMMILVIIFIGKSLILVRAASSISLDLRSVPRGCVIEPQQELPCLLIFEPSSVCESAMKLETKVSNVWSRNLNARRQRREMKE